MERCEDTVQESITPGTSRGSCQEAPEKSEGWEKVMGPKSCVWLFVCLSQVSDCVFACFLSGILYELTQKAHPSSRVNKGMLLCLWLHGPSLCISTDCQCSQRSTRLSFQVSSKMITKKKRFTKGSDII